MKVEQAHGPRARTSAPMSTTGSPAGPGSRAALRAGAGDRRAQALSACAARPLGQGDARAVLRSGRARRGARGRRQGACSASPRAANSSPWRKPSALEGIRLMQSRRRHAVRRDGVLRARAGAADARGAAGARPIRASTPKRGDHDPDPVMAQDRRGAADPPGRGAGAGGRSRRADRAADAAHASICPTIPGRSSFPGGKIEPSRRQPARRGAARGARRRSALTARIVEPIGYLDLYMTTLGFRIVPVVARVDAGFALTLNTARGRRRLRGAARFPDGPGQHAAPCARLAGHDAALLRHAVRRALHLGRDGGYLAQSVRTDLPG